MHPVPMVQCEAKTKVLYLLGASVRSVSLVQLHLQIARNLWACQLSLNQSAS